MQRNIKIPHLFQEQNFDHPLFPGAQPFREGMLPVSSRHTLYYALFGNPEGIPVVVLHGGPGAGCYPEMSRFFDLTRWFVVMFDQRGSIRSEPFGCLEENTSQHLVADLEVIREHLHIDQWVVFGGSWGSTLGILYGQAHPERCLGFILRGIFLARELDDAHLLYGMGKIFPEAYAEFLQCIPVEERNNLKLACYRRLMDPNPAIHMPVARAFMRFDLKCSTHLPDAEFVNKQLNNEKAVVSVAKTFFHYVNNDFFLKQNQIMNEMVNIAHLPAIIVHGRWDVITLPEMAYSLHQKWDNSTLWMVPLGGHSATEPAIARALAAASDLFVEKWDHH